MHHQFNRRLSRRLGFVVVAAAAALVSVTLASAVLPGSTVIKANAAGLPHAWSLITTGIVVALAVASLASLRSMLGAVERERVFARDMTRHFRRFSLFYLLSVIADLCLPPLVQLFGVVSGEPGRIVLSIDNRHLLDLLVGALLFFIARLFDEAARLEEDSRAIV